MFLRGGTTYAFGDFFATFTTNTADLLLTFYPTLTEEQRSAWRLALLDTELVIADGESNVAVLINSGIETPNFDILGLPASDLNLWEDGDEITVAMMVPVNVPAEGAPSIQGILEEDQVLTADTVGIADANGVPDGVTYTYQWVRVDTDDTATDISGATSSSYTLQQADVGKNIKLTVSFADSDDFTETLTSAETKAVVAENATRKLVWLATMTVGENFNASFKGYFRGSYGSLSPGSFKDGSDTHTVVQLNVKAADRELFHWFEAAIGVDNHADWILDVGGEFAFDERHYAIVQGKTFQFGLDTGHDALTWTAGQEEVVSIQEAVNVAATGVPTITGTVQVSEVLTANIDAIADLNGVPDPVEYQWILVDGGTETDIDGATGSTYTPVARDVGKTIKVRVSFTDNDGFSEGPFTSAATGAVQVAPAIEVSERTFSLDEGSLASSTV